MSVRSEGEGVEQSGESCEDLCLGHFSCVSGWRVADTWSGVKPLSETLAHWRVSKSEPARWVYPGSALRTVVITLNKGLLRHFLFCLGFLNTFPLLFAVLCSYWEGGISCGTGLEGILRVHWPQCPSKGIEQFTKRLLGPLVPSPSPGCSMQTPAKWLH